MGKGTCATRFRSATMPRSSSGRSGTGETGNSAWTIRAMATSTSRRAPWCTTPHGQAPEGRLLSASNTSPKVLRTVGVLVPVAAGLGVGTDDVLHQAVPDHVAPLEVHEADPLDALQDPLNFEQPRVLPSRQVDLGLVTRDHHPGVQAEARQEHLHLGGG